MLVKFEHKAKEFHAFTFACESDHTNGLTVNIFLLNQLVILLTGQNKLIYALSHWILPPEFSERIIGLMSMIGQVETMTRRLNPSADFDAAKWLGTWLDSPLPALGGDRPGSYLDTIVGQGILTNLIAIAESGAYA